MWDLVDFPSKQPEIQDVPVAREATQAQLMRDGDGFLQSREDRVRKAAARRRQAMLERHDDPEDGDDPAKTDGEWPWPFASFWTLLLLSLASIPAHSVVVSSLAFGLSAWLGQALDRWLRAHPDFGGSTFRFLMGVPPPRPRGGARTASR